MLKSQLDFNETNESFTLRVTKPSLKYLDFFIRLDCGPRLLATRFFPSAKEISETMGAFEAARQKFKLDHRDSNIAVVVIGDGHKPRTGAYTAFQTRWRVISVDPAMAADLASIEEICQGIKGLSLEAKRIEDCVLDLTGCTQVVLLYVHSHASLQGSLPALRMDPGTRLHAISMPCCFDDDLGIAPTETFDDLNVLSVVRTIHVYRDIDWSQVGK